MIEIAYGGMETDDRLARLVGTEGLDASCIELASEEFASRDGGMFTGFRLHSRTVRLRYAIVGEDPEEARAHLLGVFRIKQNSSLTIRTRDRELVARGYVSSIDYDPWSQSQTVEVTVQCLDPWLQAVSDTVFQPISTNQWTLTNPGAPVGFVAQVGRAGYVRIAGSSAQITWDASASLPADAVLTLDTREGHRDLYVESGGVRTSYLGSVTQWQWQDLPHSPEGRTVIVRSNGSAVGPLTVRYRWTGI